MLERYVKIYDAITKTANERADLRTKLLTTDEHFQVEDFFDKLSSFQDVTKELQRHDITFFEARMLFDGLCRRDPSCETYLSHAGEKVPNKAFENALYKLQSKSDISADDSQVLHKFRTCLTFTLRRTTTYEDDLIQEVREAAKRLKSQDTMEDFIDTTFIPPTSNMVERLFSCCKNVLTDYRSKLDNKRFEDIMMLKINRKLWDENTVAAAFSSKNNASENDN